MNKSMDEILLIDFEQMIKDPPRGFATPYKIMLEDIFLRELNAFNIAFKEHEIKYDDDDYAIRDARYLTQKIEILTEFTRRCELYLEILSEDLDSLAVAIRLV